MLQITADELSWPFANEASEAAERFVYYFGRVRRGIASEFNFSRSNFVKLQLLGRDDTVGRAR